MIGLHPESVKEAYKGELMKIEDALKGENNFVGIGEVGLDLHWDKTYLKQQLAVFEQQVCWALETDLPIIIHCRDAFEDMMNVLDHYSGTPLRGIFHSYTGNPFEAIKMLEMPGFLLGINGIVTYRSSVIPDVLHNISLDRIVLETDAPYLTPVPFRGKRNESSYIVHTLNKVAYLYDMQKSLLQGKRAGRNEYGSHTATPSRIGHRRRTGTYERRRQPQRKKVARRDGTAGCGNQRTIGR